MVRETLANASKKDRHMPPSRSARCGDARRRPGSTSSPTSTLPLIFIDETSASTKMARLRGRAGGERCRAPVPHGHWKTTTLTAGLRLGGIAAPMLLDGPMDGDAFPPTSRRSCSDSRAGRHRHHGQSARPQGRRRPGDRGTPAPGSCSCRPTRRTSIRSRWPSPSSRRSCERPPPEPSMSSGPPSPPPSTPSFPKECANYFTNSGYEPD